MKIETAKTKVRKRYPKAVVLCCNGTMFSLWSGDPFRWGECISGPTSEKSANRAWLEAARLLAGGEPKEDPFHRLGRELAERQNKAIWKAIAKPWKATK